MQDILEAIDEAAAAGEKVVVATVIDTIRSAPRQPGAKMVVRESGRFTGSVSGGCVEADVVERAQQIFAGEEARRVHYGVTDGEAWEVGLSCGGEIDVWVEEADPALWREVRALLDAGRLRDALHGHRDRREAPRARRARRDGAPRGRHLRRGRSRARSAWSSSAPPRRPSISAPTARISAGGRRSSMRVRRSRRPSASRAPTR